MKSILKIAGGISLIFGVLFFSCKKDYHCKGCAEMNKPPISNAGPDQSIVLPTDSVLLDGNASSDPDGTIRGWLWTKISGPASFTIRDAPAAKTVVKNLKAGVYQFELKVTDNSGLYAADTVNVNVTTRDTEPPVTTLGCNITMKTVEHLPTPGSVGYAVSAGSKILFTRNSSNGVVDIYDTLTHSWETVSGMGATGYYSASGKAAVVGNKIIFNATQGIYPYPQGQLVNIYDASSNLWSVTHLPHIRSYYSMTVAGNKAIYAGGEGPDSNIVKQIDIFDGSTNSWSVVNFNNGRRAMGVESIGNKVLFAGGSIIRYDSLVWVCDEDGNNCDSVPAVNMTNRVDIWDMASNTWSVAQLSTPRSFMVTAAVGNKMIFAGGDQLDWGVNQVDIFDVANNSWSSYTLSTGIWPGPCRAYTVGDKVLICNWNSERIDIYDASLNSWSVVHMPAPLIGEQHQFGLVATAGNKAVFFVQYNREENSKNIDIYDAASNTWCRTQLNQLMIRQGIVVSGNRIYVAGGSGSSSIFNSFDIPLDNVWLLNY